MIMTKPKDIPSYIWEMKREDIVRALNELCMKTFEEKKGGGNELEYLLHRTLFIKGLINTQTYDK